MSEVELFGAALGVLAVILTIRQNPWCWPIGLVMVAIYSWLFFGVKLYSQVLLQLIYAVLQLYGWWQWTRHGDNVPARAVTTLQDRSILGGLAVGALLGAALGAGMAHFTDAAQPWLDAALTSFSLVAQLWMAQKRLQCWPLWIVLNVISVGLFLHQALHAMAAVYALFTLLAILGWREWRVALVPAR
ncbi:nicotinamide riboside transporter PnuC [Pseudomonas ovata]|uniref:nicotinamide riboside transporter PnuC n=1 Tax=Pseudomonas ovata TaxID=1839709 RepID=UPI000D690EC3|nr:nicotinamide riboside transporter PnuC [Pseudomonas ovata]